MFFANKVILVEGEEDIIAILATGRELSLFREFPEELGVTIVSTGSKQEMPKFMKILNSFRIPYIILHELDGNPNSDDSRRIRELLNDNREVTIPLRLEDSVGHQGHFQRAYYAKKYFENPDNITNEFKEIITAMF